MQKESLQELYIDELRDLYNAETQLVKALPKMAKAALNGQLRGAFEEHLQQTLGHVSRRNRSSSSSRRSHPARSVLA